VAAAENASLKNLPRDILHDDNYLSQEKNIPKPL